MADSPDRSNERARDFEARIRRCLRQFDPETFAIECAKLLQAGASDTTILSRAPPHFVVHAIEANCAYSSARHRRGMRNGDLAQAINLWHRFSDPYLRFQVQPDSDLLGFSHFMHRTQLQLQWSPGLVPVARSWMLFCRAGVDDPVDAKFREATGVGVCDWVRLCFAFFAGTSNKRFPGVTRSYVQLQEQLDVAPETISAFLKEVARTPDQIGTAYRAARHDVEPFLRSQLRRYLFTHPIIEFQSGFLVPMPGLLLRSLYVGIPERCKRLPNESIQRILADRFSDYVQCVFTENLPTVQKVQSEDDLAKGSGLPVCDWLIETDQEILLIECKNTMLDTRLATTGAVQTSNASKKVVDGIMQIVDTAEREYTGARSGKRISGIVATFGELPCANAAAMWEGRYWNALKEKQYSEARVRAALGGNLPVVADAVSVDLLAIWCRSTQGQIADVLDEWRAGPYLLVGDVRQFMAKKVESPQPEAMDYWRPAFKEFWATFPLDRG